MGVGAGFNQDPHVDKVFANLLHEIMLGCNIGECENCFGRLRISGKYTKNQ